MLFPLMVEGLLCTSRTCCVCGVRWDISVSKNFPALHVSGEGLALKTKTTELEAQVKVLEGVSSEKDALIEKYKMEIKEGDDLMQL